MTIFKEKIIHLLFGFFLGLTLYNVIFAFKTDFYQIHSGGFNTFVKVLMLIIGLIAIANSLRYLDLDSEIVFKSRLLFLSSAIIAFTLLYFFTV